MFITLGQSSIKKPMGQEKIKESMTGIPILPPRRSLVPTKADVWERNKMEKISKRYILSASSVKYSISCCIHQSSGAELSCKSLSS